MSNHSKSISKILPLILTLILSTNAFGQATTGTVEGTVSDSIGAAISGAEITVENKSDSTGFEKSVLTNDRGYFVIAEVPPGTYKFSTKANSFSTVSYEVEIFADKVLVTNPSLAAGVAASVETKIVSDYGLSADATPEIRTNNKKVFLENLPRRTTFSSLLKIAPNVRPETFAGGFQIDGASGSENVFFIDGQEVTNFKTGLLNANNDLPFELVQEVQVKSEALAAETAGALGGVINVVTRGGNNAWRRNFGVSLTPGRFQGEPNAALNRFGSAAGQIEYFGPNRDGGTGFFPTATLSGPVFKDKLWFFASYSPQIYKQTRTIDYYTSPNPATRAVIETIEYATNVRTEAAFVRFDAQPVSNLRMTGSFLYNPIIQDGALPANTEGLGGAPQSVAGLRGTEFLATRGGRQNSNIASGQISWDINKNFLLTFRAGRSFLNEKLDTYGIPRVTRFICAASGAPETVPGSNCSRGFQNIANNAVRDFEVSERTTFEAEGAVFGINAFGRHSFKFGFGYNHLFNEIREGYTDTGIIQLFYNVPINSLGVPVTPTPGNLGSGFLQRFGTVGSARNTNHALYVQDSWTIKNRLFLNFGVRFENETLPGYREDLGVKFGWGEKIAPRVAVAFDVFGGRKTKVFGNYGWYYDRLKYNAFQLQFSQIFFRDFFEILPSRGAAYTNYTFPQILGNNIDDPRGNCPIVNSTGWSVCQFGFTIPTNIPVFPDTLPLIDPDLKPSRSSALTVGAEQRLGANFLIAGRFTHRRLDRAIEDISNFNNQGSEFFIIANPGEALICEAAAGANLPCPKAERRYDAFEILLDKRAADYFFNASYTFSRLVGNYSGLASSDEVGRVSPNFTRYFDLPAAGFDADGNPDNGRLATDRPHVFKAYGGYTFDWNGNSVNRTSLAALTTIQSGTPLTSVYSLYGIQNSILFGRGDLGRTEIFSETDLLVSHRYKFGRDKRFAVEPFAIFLNLFDERNELGRQTSISLTNFTAATLTQGGCTTCTSQPGVYNTIFNQGGIRQFVENFLNSRGTSATGTRNDYNQPNLFQLPREVRLGVRFMF